MSISTIQSTGRQAFTLARRVAAAGALAALLAAVVAPALPVAAGGCGATPAGSGSSDGDYDGLTCYQEFSIYGTDSMVYDTDVDGLGDGAEILAYFTNPLVYDTDGDGASDGQEVSIGSDPLLANYFIVDPTDPGNGDSDEDGLWNAEEIGIYFTDVYDWDTDGDGLSDGAEVNVYGTNPLRFDTDGDTASDGYELAWGSNPLIADPYGAV